jgi:lipopolysaccharide/colanic/teichoic acid biosynthesis glycosyltransferase
MKIVKRLFDFGAALVLMLVCSPLLLAICALVRVQLGKPIFFRQTRAGRGGKPFELVKFRSLTNATGANDELLPDSERLTRFGKLLRRTSLDELPQLWNVLKGDMSLVGPRPLLMDYLPLYNGTQARRHDVRPGVTGWAQVNGRNALGWEEKFALDTWYVEHWSLALDFRILLVTIKHVLLAQGISADGEATMPRFTGSGGK